MNGTVPLLPHHALMKCTGTPTITRLTLQTYNKQRMRPSMYVELKTNEITHHVSKKCTNACHPPVDVHCHPCNFILPSTLTSRKRSLPFQNVPCLALCALVCQLFPHHDFYVNSSFRRCVNEICALLVFTQRRMVVCYGRFGSTYPSL